jgi:WXXGXW repeat (2 copies)
LGYRSERRQLVQFRIDGEIEFEDDAENNSPMAKGARSRIAFVVKGSRRMTALYKWLGSRTAFCVWLALGMVGLRVALFDYRYFLLDTLPNHDMSQGLAFFTTSMHSMRLTGDVAWWNPIGDNGYAQYYQSFLSPLAPTTHHISFILWAQLIRALSFAGIVIPEYYQYLIVNFLILPFLAAWSFALFASLLFRRRSTVLLVSVAYTLSGIGIWNSAWFYFQEPFTLFLLLAACLAALRRPTPRRLLLLAAAVLVQITSFNYWTLYNAFFIGIVLGAYSWIHPFQVRRFARRVFQVMRCQRWASGLLGLLSLAALVAGMGLIACIVREQVGANKRTAGEFKAYDALRRLHEMRTFTLELFNPNVQRPLEAYKNENPVHNARYIGCVLLPLLLLLFVRRWGRRERFLVTASVCVLIICLAPPLLLQVWEWVPLMNRIRHLFYFYSQYWQIMIVLLAGSSLDALLRHTFAAADRQRFLWVVGGLCALLGLLLLALCVCSHLFPADDVHLQGNLHFALLTLVASGVLLQMLWHPDGRNRGIFIAVLLALLVMDLSKYFWEVCLLDRTFTQSRWENPIEPEFQATLRRPWSLPDTDKDFSSGLRANLPLFNTFWPHNHYIQHYHLGQLGQVENLWPQTVEGATLHFSHSARLAQEPDEALRLIGAEPAVLAGHDVLLLQTHPEWIVSGPAAAAEMPEGGPPTSENFEYRCRKWDYNSFGFEISAPCDGWLCVHQIHDRNWQVTVDGQRVRAAQANFAATGLPLRRGTHSLEMVYWPPSRRLYWPVCWLLEGTLAALLTAALLAGPAAVRTPFFLAFFRAGLRRRRVLFPWSRGKRILCETHLSERRDSPMSVRSWFFILGMLGLMAALAAKSSAADQPPPDPTPKGVEVQARGPVHEAYAQPSDVRPLPSVTVPKQPPALIDELPPEQKPEGDNVQWLPGYWAWDEDQKDYLWVSGFWRIPPPNRQWVPGNWQPIEGGWQWTPGFWAAAGLQQVEYLPAPPPSVDNGPSTPTPNDNSLYAPGCWVYREKKYFWRPGFWVDFRPGWVWIPARYLWTPGGYVFVEGYWDHPLEQRGLLFAPIRLVEPALYTARWTYTPYFVVQPDFLIGALFVRPNYCHYYFGDFFEAKYKDRGFIPWCDYRVTKAVFDPNFAYYRQVYRADPAWEHNLRDLYAGRATGVIERPPHTLVQQTTALRNFSVNKTENVLIGKNINLTRVQNVSVLAPVTRINNTRVTTLSALSTKNLKVEDHVLKVEKVTQEQRTEIHKAVAPFRETAQTRHVTEAKMLTEGRAPVKVTDISRSVKIDLPKAPVVTRVQRTTTVTKEVPRLPELPKHEERAIPAHEAPKFPRPKP